MAAAEARVLITNDKDFGAKVVRERRSYHGVVLLRPDDERPVSKIRVIARLPELYADKLPDSSVVVSERRVKFGKARR